MCLANERRRGRCLPVPYSRRPADIEAILERIIGGHIRVAARVVENGRLSIEVADDSVGMTVEEQSKIFDRFYRVKNRLTQGAGGTGLGLAIARSLAQLHGGDITVSSVPGEGSVFRFTLALAGAQNPDGERSAVEALG
jgi:signal transduction histidine kinase